MINIKLKLVLHTKESAGWIHVFFYLKNEKVHFSTKVQCEQKHWNEKTMRVRSGDPNVSDKNLILENILARINSVMVKFRLKDKNPNRNTFLKAYNRPDDYDSFYNFADVCRKKFSRILEFGTMKNHITVLKKLKEYAPELHFDDITEDFITGYFCYLTKDLKNNLNTAYKNLVTIQKYVSEAVNQGYIDDNPFKNFTIPRLIGNYTYLSEDEIMKLIKVYHEGNLPAQKYKTLQLFLFMCFSSQHNQTY